MLFQPRLVVTVVAVACLGAGPPQGMPSPPSTPTVESPVPSDSPRTVQGPAVEPVSALIAWLEGDGGKKLVQLPVVVVPSVLGLASGRLGGVEIRLDDAAMSVSLADRIRKDCPMDVECAIWVEGTWGANVDLGLGGGEPTFSVREYRGKVEGVGTFVRVVE
jgi:hypothetical protein